MVAEPEVRHTTFMNADRLHYPTGEEVHAGDRVAYGGKEATVAFVSDGDSGEFLPGYEDYSGYERGIMLCDDDSALTFLHEGDEQLELVAPA